MLLSSHIERLRVSSRQDFSIASLDEKRADQPQFVGCILILWNRRTYEIATVFVLQPKPKAS